MSKQITNKDLRASFKIFNNRFFDGRINLPITNVRFADNEDCEDSDGLFTGDEILVHQDLKKHPDFAMITLLHEMVHADLRQDGYVGYQHDGGHHTRFYGGLDRLYKAGAFEGLL